MWQQSPERSWPTPRRSVSNRRQWGGFEERNTLHPTVLRVVGSRMELEWQKLCGSCIELLFVMAAVRTKNYSCTANMPAPTERVQAASPEHQCSRTSRADGGGGLDILGQLSCNDAKNPCMLIARGYFSKRPRASVIPDRAGQSQLWSSSAASACQKSNIATRNRTLDVWHCLQAARHCEDMQYSAPLPK